MGEKERKKASSRCKKRIKGQNLGENEVQDPGSHGDVEFEDAFADEFEEEEIKEVCSDDGGVGGDEDGYSGIRTYVPGMEDIEGEGEEMEMNPNAYVMFHSLRPEWPCLSFDFVADGLGVHRTRFPHTFMAVSGTQTSDSAPNKLQLMRMTDLYGLSHHHKGEGEDCEEEDDTDDSEDQDPVLDHIDVLHDGVVNRVRAMNQTPGVIASWSDTGRVFVWDLTSQLQAMTEQTWRGPPPFEPAHTICEHEAEGYALDWSDLKAGQLVSGDLLGSILLTRCGDGQWITDGEAFVGHKKSVEDLKWSPSEVGVFASASADHSVAVWDLRRRASSMISLPKAHDGDVNVISWNRNVTYLLASGDDNGLFKVWDLRSFKKTAPEPVAQFRWHTKQVTSIEWHPTDESMLAVAGADDQVTIWDLSVEEDEEAMGLDPKLRHLPPQLLFIHQGQKNIKEVHWHPQIPGLLMTTAMDGFHIFKPAIVLQGEES